MGMCIREKDNTDDDWITKYLKENWGSDFVVTKGNTYRSNDVLGFIAEIEKERVGIGLYHIYKNECEIVVLESMQENIGIGTLVLERIIEKAKSIKWFRIWLITTNDNVKALRYYQKRGFELVALYRNAIVESRKIKPEIPMFGNDGIPIKDEIELEIVL